eukprot:scaffold1181_cov67-Cyclotella_meneghiniana.AAC.6
MTLALFENNSQLIPLCMTSTGSPDMSLQMLACRYAHNIHEPRPPSSQLITSHHSPLNSELFHILHISKTRRTEYIDNRVETTRIQDLHSKLTMSTSRENPPEIRNWYTWSWDTIANGDQNEFSCIGVDNIFTRVGGWRDYYFSPGILTPQNLIFLKWSVAYVLKNTCMKLNEQYGHGDNRSIALEAELKTPYCIVPKKSHTDSIP